MVIEAIEHNPQTRDIERKRIVEKLRNSDTKIAKMNRPYDRAINWMLNVQAQQKQKPFHAVVGRRNEIEVDNFLNISELDDTHPLWKISHDAVVPRNAWDLASCARLLLQISKKIIIIDPNFDPVEQRFIETLSLLLVFACVPHVPERLELHAEYSYHKNQRRENDWKEDCRTNLPPLIPDGFSVEIFQWEAKWSGDKPHARYVLTERGGIRYDYGIDEGAGQTTDVSV
jgi:hypothetical protein